MAPYSGFAPGQVQPRASELFVFGVQAVLVMAFVALMTIAEQALLALAVGAVCTCLRRIKSSCDFGLRKRIMTTSAVADGKKLTWCAYFSLGYIRRRGPPTASRV